MSTLSKELLGIEDSAAAYLLADTRLVCIPHTVIQISNSKCALVFQKNPIKTIRQKSRCLMYKMETSMEPIENTNTHNLIKIYASRDIFCPLNS